MYFKVFILIFENELIGNFYSEFQDVKYSVTLLSYIPSQNSPSKNCLSYRALSNGILLK